MTLGSSAARHTPPEGTASAPSVPARVAATVDADFWDLFTPKSSGLTGQTGSGRWSGGDSTCSVPLPDGRTVWLFSDTFLGPINPDGSRPPTAPLIHNSLVVQEGETLTTLHGGSPSAPRAYFTPADGSSWYWISGGVVDGGFLYVFLLKFVRHGSQYWEWDWTGTDLARLRLPSLQVESIRPVPVRNGIRYGAALLQTDEYTYIFGVEDLHYEKFAHLARVPRGTPHGSWTFFDGGGWSALPGRSARILTDSVGTEFSVIPVRGGYLLITVDTSLPVSEWRDIVAFFADAPEGPWVRDRVLYRATEPDRRAIFVYNAHAHPQFSTGSDLLISYDVNSNRVEDVYADANLFRARFVRVDLPEYLPET